jgi:hypothetical protein
MVGTALPAGSVAGLDAVTDTGVFVTVSVPATREDT